MFGELYIIDNYLFSGEKQLGIVRNGIFTLTYIGYIPKEYATRLWCVNMSDESRKELKKYI